MGIWRKTPRAWDSTAVAPAALPQALNDDLRGFALGFGPWTSYTPTLAQGASSDISKNIDYAKYLQVQNLVICHVQMRPTGTGTAGSAITITLPVTAASALDWQFYGVGGYYDNGSAFYPGFVSLNSTTKAQLFRADGNPLSAIGSNPNIAVAATDIWSGTFTYEAA